MGRLVMIGLSHLAGEWRLATFLHGALCCCTLLLILFLPESVIWLRRIVSALAFQCSEHIYILNSCQMVIINYTLERLCAVLFDVRDYIFAKI